MADRTRSVNILIKARNDADAVLKSLVSTLTSVQGIATAVAAGAAYMGAAFAAVTARAIKQEEADLRLAVALRSVGENTAEAREALGQLASDLQDSTGQSDEAIQEVMATLIQLGRVGVDQLPRVTRATLELAAVTGKDLASAGELMARAAQGQTASLSRLGIILDESIPKTERLGALVKFLETNSKGTAEALGQGLGVALKRIVNDVDDLLQKIGGATVENEAFRAVLAAVSKGLKAATEFVGKHREGFEELITLWARSVLALARMGVQLATWQIQLIDVNLEVAQLVVTWAKLVELAPHLAKTLFGAESAKELKDAAKWGNEFLVTLQKLRDAGALAGSAGQKALAELARIIDELKTKKPESIPERLGKGVTAAVDPLKEFNETLKTLGVDTLPELKTKTDAFWQSLNQLAALAEAGIISPEDFDILLGQFLKLSETLPTIGEDLSKLREITARHTQEVVTLGEEIQTAIGGAGTNAALQFGDTLVDAAFGAKIAWGQFFKQLLADIAKAIARTLILRAISLIGGPSGFAVAAAADRAAGGAAASAGALGQSGGLVWGGFPGLDSVAAMLTPGEIILPTNLRDDFDAIAELGHQIRGLRGEARAAIGGGPSAQILNRIDAGGRSRADIANLIGLINEAVERGGFRLVSSEVLS